MKQTLEGGTGRKGVATILRLKDDNLNMLFKMKEVSKRQQESGAGRVGGGGARGY